jgi:hypothetical protein
MSLRNWLSQPVCKCLRINGDVATVRDLETAIDATDTGRKGNVNV